MVTVGRKKEISGKAAIVAGWEWGEREEDRARTKTNYGKKNLDLIITTD